MSMTDCPRCWDSPCTCGWDYRQKTIEQLEELIKILQRVVQFKKEFPTVKLPYKPTLVDETLFLNFMKERT